MRRSLYARSLSWILWSSRTRAQRRRRSLHGPCGSSACPGSGAWNRPCRPTCSSPRRLAVHNWRGFDHFEWTPAPVHLLTGPNGGGKTLLLKYLFDLAGLAAFRADPTGLSCESSLGAGSSRRRYGWSKSLPLLEVTALSGSRCNAPVSHSSAQPRRDWFFGFVGGI